MGKPDGAEFLEILEEIIGGTAEVLSSVREWEADAVGRGDEEAVELLSRMRSDIDHYGGATQDRMMSVLRRMMGEMGQMGLFVLIILWAFLWPNTGLFALAMVVPPLLFLGP